MVEVLFFGQVSGGGASNLIFSELPLSVFRTSPSIPRFRKP